jgi:NADH-quinone oxidoreductase subunit M
MTHLPLPWIELAILLPLVGAVAVRFVREADAARRQSLWFAGAALVCASFAWLSLKTMEASPSLALEQWDLVAQVFGHDLFVLDELSAPLLPLAALVYLLTGLATLRTKVRRFSFSSMLASEAILLATLACKQPWVLVALLTLGTIPPWLELRQRGRPTRVFAIHMAVFIGLLIAGQALQSLGGAIAATPLPAVLLMAAILVRNGIVPLHCWLTDLFENATFGTALLFVTPMVGAYAALRLVLPIAPDWVLRWLAMLSLITAVYAACMALVQTEARRFFCYLFLSHSSLVLVGLEIVNTIGLTGALCVWISVVLSMAGFGLTLRSVESRTGRLSLSQFHGLYEHTPLLASLFLIMGLGSVGFPGTIGFVGAELLVEGAVELNPIVGLAIVMAAALNGLAILHCYFRVFTGIRHVTRVDLRLRWPEVAATLILIALIVGGGLFPQPGVASRYHAAAALVRERRQDGGALAPTAFFPTGWDSLQSRELPRLSDSRTLD